MIEVIVGLIFIIISAEFNKISKKINKEYLFKNRKYYYPISFFLNLVGATLLFDGYGIWMALLTLFTMITYDKYIHPRIENKKEE